MQAVNMIGESEWSELADCMTAASVPSQPEAPYVTNSTTTSAIIGWHAPCDNGAPILHYQVAALHHCLACSMEPYVEDGTLLWNVFALPKTPLCCIIAGLPMPKALPGAALLRQ